MTTTSVLSRDVREADGRVFLGGGGRDVLPEVVEAPVPGLVRRLTELPVADVSSRDLVTAVAGWQRVIGAAMAAQAAALVELERRGGVVAQFLDDEVACALGTTRLAVQVLRGRARWLDEHPRVHDALASGLLDVRKVDALADGTQAATTAVARRVVDGALERLREAHARQEVVTVPALRRLVRRLLAAEEPPAAAEAVGLRRADRHVTTTWADPSMASVRALLPAEHAAAMMSVLDAVADRDLHRGDPRTGDQRRADAFADVFLQVLDAGVLPDGRPLPRRQGRRASIQVTVAASTLAGLDDRPGELAGLGPVPASVARELAQDGTWRRLLTDPATGAVMETGRVTYRPGADVTRTVVARDVTCVFPGCRRPAERCDLDHVEPFDPRRPAEDQTTADNLQALCRTHHRAKTHGRWSVRRDRATGAIHWRSPLGHDYVRRPTQVVHVDEPALHRRPPPRPPGDEPPPPF
ncbi:HNH endonuclease signature motif containing protein [Cellulomonas massiliensis]|uniref:HNH endonuclease signature motif containing protein n=1 Tax=Cellulomonas massiliensis TaxID=1465811 RepID=UPI0011C90A5F|nr:HNH endonuclease signature motif containing protein [Cellulomonas massiliensis]